MLYQCYFSITCSKRHAWWCLQDVGNWIWGGRSVGKHLLCWCKNWSWDTQNLSENPKGCDVLLVIPVIRGQWQISPGESSLARLDKLWSLSLVTDLTSIKNKLENDWGRHLMSVLSLHICVHTYHQHIHAHTCMCTHKCAAHICKHAYIHWQHNTYTHLRNIKWIINCGIFNKGIMRNSCASCPILTSCLHLKNVKAAASQDSV